MEIVREIIEYVMPKANTTMIGGGNTIFNMLGIVILIAIATGVMAILLNVSANIEKYHRFKRILKLLGKSFSYCAYGMLTVAIIGVPVFLGYNLLNAAVDNPEASLEVFKWIGIIAGAFVGFTLVGYATKNRIWKRIWKFHKEDQLYKDTMKELPNETL